MEEAAFIATQTELMARDAEKWADVEIFGVPDRGPKWGAASIRLLHEAPRAGLGTKQKVAIASRNCFRDDQPVIYIVFKGSYFSRNGVFHDLGRSPEGAREASPLRAQVAEHKHIKTSTRGTPSEIADSN